MRLQLWLQFNSIFTSIIWHLVTIQFHIAVTSDTVYFEKYGVRLHLFYRFVFRSMHYWTFLGSVATRGHFGKSEIESMEHSLFKAYFLAPTRSRVLLFQLFIFWGLMFF